MRARGAPSQPHTGKMEQNVAELTFVISGPRWIPQDYFDQFYRPPIEKAFRDPASRFVLGDAEGTDRFAQSLLRELGAGADRVTIFIRSGKKASYAAQGFTVDDFSESDAELAQRLGLRSKHPICVLPLFGTLLATSGVMTLEERHTRASASPSASASASASLMLPALPPKRSASLASSSSSTSSLRRFSDTALAHSEPYDPRFEKLQAMLYFLWYSRQRELSLAAIDEFVEFLRRNRPAARGGGSPQSD